jgi:hypothetical protein
MDHPSTRSINRFHPRHSTRVPGGPSFFLAKYPPSLAIDIGASAMEGGAAGRLQLRVCLKRFHFDLSHHC